MKSYARETPCYYDSGKVQSVHLFGKDGDKRDKHTYRRDRQGNGGKDIGQNIASLWVKKSHKH